MIGLAGLESTGQLVGITYRDSKGSFVGRKAMFRIVLLYY